MDTPQPTSQPQSQPARRPAFFLFPFSFLLGPGPRWKKVLADLWGNKTRTILAVLSIAVGVVAVGMVGGAALVMTTDMQRGYLAANPAQAQISMNPFGEELITTVRHTPGVADVQGALIYSVRVEAQPGVWKDLQLIALEDPLDQRVNKLGSVAGQWPPGRRQVVIENSTLTVSDLAMGRDVLIELPDGRQRTLPVVGITRDVTFYPAFFGAPMRGFVSFETMEWLGMGRFYNQLSITVADHGNDTARIKAVLAAVEDRIVRSGRTPYTWIPTPGESPMAAGTRAMIAVLTILAILIVFLSTFLIVNTIGALMLQQRRQIGVMKAVGATAGQIAGLYMVYVLGLGLLAALIAIPGGALLGHQNNQFLGSLMNYEPSEFGLHPGVVALQLAIVLVIPPLAAIGPILGGVGITVREALASTGLGRGRFGSRRLDRLLERVRFLSRPLLLSLRNTFRRKGRLALTLVTLTLGGAIFIAVNSVQVAMDRQTDLFMNYFGEDVRIDFGNFYRIDQVTEIALSTPGVERVEVWRVDLGHRLRPDGSAGEQLVIFGAPNGTPLLKPLLVRGRWLLPEDANAIVVDTQFVRNEPDADVGALITMKIGDLESAWRIVGVSPQLGNGNPIAYANYAYFSRLQGHTADTTSLRVQAARHDPAFQKALADELARRFKAADISVSSSQTSGEYRQSIDQQFGLIVRFLRVMAVMIAVVGAIGLMGTMSMNVVERTREIGVLRAIGAGNGDIQLIVVAEGLLIGVLSWALAALLAVPIGRVMGDGVGVGFLSNPLPHAYSLFGAGLWLGIVALLAALASALPAWRASHLTVRDVLAYE